MTENVESTTQSDLRLEGSIVVPSAITHTQRHEMCRLLQTYFDNVSLTRFNADLDEKDWVFLFQDPQGTIRGFSTLMQFSVQLDGEEIVAYYSGDTIIDPSYWQELELPKLWGRHVFAQAQAIPDRRVFWFLISSGYKTYRFLPVFFREFYPTYRRPAPHDIQQILDTVAQRKFGDAYDPATGLIRLADAAPLRPGVADVTEQRKQNQDIAYFLQRNPRHCQGEQLACLVEIRRDNLTPAGRRMLGN